MGQTLPPSNQWVMAGQTHQNWAYSRIFTGAFFPSVCHFGQRMGAANRVHCRGRGHDVLLPHICRRILLVGYYLDAFTLWVMGDVTINERLILCSTVSEVPYGGKRSQIYLCLGYRAV